MKQCLNCGKNIPKGGDSRKKFCNRSCSATFNNLKRDYPEGSICIDCGKKIDSGSIRCLKCKRLFTQNIYESRTLGDVKKEGNSRIAWSGVRTRANTKMELAGIEKVCHECGITEPIDCCHIKDIVDFSEDSLISEVNSFKNLVYLCKNHHWLLDNNKLQLSHSSSG